ncbi:hypothetical protein HRS9139_10397 [Pyrenophora teres f. teres]|uniref:Uncharacterized protein n=1 Tax=Pyrenophora teres f. teres TaxID=97479 RepID=A0A6S6WBI2_9PLEO|nr:hypothetical protein HRS9139_10397 [Pyrenophora teres f. teres]KAE8825915.1 hypothetical protein HRS9122_10100 [Pyrenophora teres f. teres]CAE7205204.1 hypothetical protein PTTW11_09260 [Pyrenophora teres f. teres]
MKLLISLACVSILSHSANAWFCITPPGTFTVQGLCRFSNEEKERDLYCTSPCTRTGNPCGPTSGDNASCS